MQRGTDPGPGTALTRIPLRIPMSARATDEPHRAATQLELLFDLTFVVAVAAVVAQLGRQLRPRNADSCRGRSAGVGAIVAVVALGAAAAVLVTVPRPVEGRGGG
jgi:hypothetical protein